VPDILIYFTERAQQLPLTARYIGGSACVLADLLRHSA
jgi:hypothetical protein